MSSKTTSLQSKTIEELKKRNVPKNSQKNQHRVLQNVEPKEINSSGVGTNLY
jgi:hypothetical protein